MREVFHNGLKGLVLWDDDQNQLHVEPLWSGVLGFIAWVNGRVMVALGLQGGERHAKKPHRHTIIRK